MTDEIKLPDLLTRTIEKAYYAKIQDQARFSRLKHDPHFWSGVFQHPAIFSDHGITHVRDVAARVELVLATVHGLFIAKRSTARYAFMQAYGLLLAYVHDIGMVDFSPFGRKMHPEFAAQEVFRSSFDPLIAEVWRCDPGALCSRLERLFQRSHEKNRYLLLRELLAMALGHSKSKVPAAMLNDLPRLHERMVAGLWQPLREPVPAGSAQPFPAASASESGSDHRRRLAGFGLNRPEESFRWLLRRDPAGRALVADVIDTIRVLRCADALRQRGTTLKTSGGYEIFIDQTTGRAIFALRDEFERLFMLELSSSHAIGEANLAASELERQGNLRFAFHRGSFFLDEGVDLAAAGAVQIIRDIYEDAIESFFRPPGEKREAGLKSAGDMEILIEETEDNLDFSPRIASMLAARFPDLTGRIKVVPSLEQVSERERDYYLAGKTPEWSPEKWKACLVNLAAGGHPVDRMDLEKAFNGVRQIEVDPGQVLIEAGEQAAFVYIPLDARVEVIPLGGYKQFEIKPWMPLGVTGVVRGAMRNGTVRTQARTTLLMIPRSKYLKHWHITFSPEELRRRLDDGRQRKLPPIPRKLAG